MTVADPNAEVNLDCVELYSESYNENSLIKVPTCHKNLEKQQWIIFY